MGEMRHRMENELKLRGYSPATLKAYLRVVHGFVQHQRRPAEEMGSPEARAYLLHLMEEKHLAWPTINQAVCALRFFYGQVLRRPFEVEMIPYQRREFISRSPRIFCATASPPTCSIAARICATSRTCLGIAVLRRR